jgi:hypothetical protein
MKKSKLFPKNKKSTPKNTKRGMTMEGFCVNKIYISHTDKSKMEFLTTEFLKGEGGGTLLGGVESVGENTLYVEIVSKGVPLISLYEVLGEGGYKVKSNYLSSTNTGKSIVGFFEGKTDSRFDVDMNDIQSINKLPKQLIEKWNLTELHTSLFGKK